MSLYVPCFNGARWLAECLDSLLGQTRPADEVLVVDDGSTDESAAIARAYAPRVTLVSHDGNRGLAVARNTALSVARGELVASVDADVRAEPAWLGRLLTAFHSPRVAAVGGRLEEAHGERLADRWRANHMAQHAGDTPRLDPPVLPGANVAVRRDVVRGLGGYDESFRTNYEDADLQHRLIAAGYRCAYEPGALAWHLRRDSAASVLRTYWGWLRPPFERGGAFRDAAGLLEKAGANAGFARRALWRDLGGGDARLAALSLLVLLAFPGADLGRAATLAAERGETARAGALAAAAGSWAVRAPQALRARAAPLAAAVRGDLARLAWWDDGAAGAAGATGAHRGDAAPSAWAGAEPDRALVDALLAVVTAAVEGLPRTWWPAIEDARQRLAAEEGWSLGTAGAEGETDGGSVADPGGVGAWLARAAGPAAQAVVQHGALGRGEAVSWAPHEVLLVLRWALSEGERERLQAGLAARLRDPDARLDTIEAHRLGWIPPSLLQQSLLAGGVLLWGDGAVLRAVPSWPPERLDPLLALDEVRGAASDVAAGRARLGVSRAMGALLIARRAHTPWHRDRADALRSAWPEAPDPRDVTAQRFVERAAALLEDWLFTWEGRGPGSVAIERYRRQRARALTS